MVLLGEVAGRRAEFNLAELIFRDASLRASSGAGRRQDVETADRACFASGSLRPVMSEQAPAWKTQAKPTERIAGPRDLRPGSSHTVAPVRHMRIPRGHVALAECALVWPRHGAGSAYPDWPRQALGLGVAVDVAWADAAKQRA